MSDLQSMHKTNCMQSIENISMWEVLVAYVLKSNIWIVKYRACILLCTIGEKICKLQNQSKITKQITTRNDVYETLCPNSYHVK